MTDFHFSQSAPEAPTAREAELLLALRQLAPDVEGALYGGERRAFENGFWKARDTVISMVQEMMESDTRPAADAVALPPLPKCKMLVGQHLDSLHVLYSADQVREIQREAYEAGRANGDRAPATSAAALSKNDPGALPSSIAAMLPNGKAVTNVYDAYEAGLEQAAQHFEQPVFDQQKCAMVVSEIRALKRTPTAKGGA